MNKAFVREPEDTGAAHCPRCGSLGIAVGGETLTAQLTPDDRRSLPESAYYCPFPRCEVGYFDQFDRWVPSDSLLHPAWPKDPTAPICPCFGFTCEEIEADVREQSTRRVKELLARTKSAEARCTTLSPSGQCCMGEVQRYFMRLRG
ncbi:MAG: hypothetical protein B7Z73_03165 [Planctomycetia bacterium 21-64-5]|nr:MAG: hypothetical protein B7Z73_03165 [Planctomycetia bacterium 21-64-5]HQU43691.1 hypothetical protein [Pirellulales bacterium]